MPSQDKLFLSSSIDSSHALTELFDFVWPTSAALWNFKWQTSGFLAACPDATEKDLLGRFVFGSGVYGVNVKKIASEQSWEDMQQWFSRLLLSEICALFEGWIESALDELKVPVSVRKQGTRDANKLGKQLQFPSTFDPAGQVIDGSAYAVAKIVSATPSATMMNCFQPTQLKNKKNSSAKIENLLICYRVFKEVRNDFVHHGGRASNKTLSEYFKYAAETPATLGTKEKPVLVQPIKGQVIQLSLRGVVGFSDVVLRLIATYDQLLTRAPYADIALKNKWIEVHKGRVIVKAAGPGRDKKIASLIKKCGLPNPCDLSSLYNHLYSKGLVA